MAPNLLCVGMHQEIADKIATVVRGAGYTVMCIHITCINTTCN